MISATFVKIGAVVTSPDGASLLATRKRGSNVFILPGGKPLPGETELEALHREIREELDARVHDAQFLAEATERSAIGGGNVTMRMYRTTIIGRPAPSSEIAEVRWVTVRPVVSDCRLGSVIVKHVLPRLVADLERR